MDYELNMDRLHTLYENVKLSDSVQTSTVDFWLASFLKWRNSTMASATMAQHLNSQLNHVPETTDRSGRQNLLKQRRKNKKKLQGENAYLVNGTFKEDNSAATHGPVVLANLNQTHHMDGQMSPGIPGMCIKAEAL